MAVSLAISEIFSVKEWPDLEIWVWGRTRSLKMAPFDRSHTSSCSPSTVTMAYLVSFARYSDLSVENREIFIPHLYLAPCREWPCKNFVKMFDADKTKMIGLPYSKNKKLSCCREAAGCFVFVCSQLQHTAQFFITSYCGFRFTSA